MDTIPCWHIVISGFSQHKHSELNGMVELWARLQQQYGKTCPVLLKAWNDCVRDLAGLIFKLRDRHIPPRIQVYAYSWGGATAIDFAKELQRYGLIIENLVLSDAVYRHCYWLGQWRAFAPVAIRMPRNILEVDWYIQQNPRFSWERVKDGGGQRIFEPAGHKLIWSGPPIDGVTNVLHPPVIVRTGRCHSAMDDLLEFHQKCLEVASR